MNKFNSVLQVGRRRCRLGCRHRRSSLDQRARLREQVALYVGGGIGNPTDRFIWRISLARILFPVTRESNGDGDAERGGYILATKTHTPRAIPKRTARVFLSVQEKKTNIWMEDAIYMWNRLSLILMIKVMGRFHENVILLRARGERKSRKIDFLIEIPKFPQRLRPFRIIIKIFRPYVFIYAIVQ